MRAAGSAAFARVTPRVSCPNGPFEDPADAADRLTDVLSDGAPDVAFGADPATGMVSATTLVDAFTPTDAVVTSVSLLGRLIAEAHLSTLAVRASATVPVPGERRLRGRAS